MQKGVGRFVTQAWSAFEAMPSLLAVPAPSVQPCPVTCRRGLDGAQESRDATFAIILLPSLPKMASPEGSLKITRISFASALRNSSPIPSRFLDAKWGVKRSQV